MQVSVWDSEEHAAQMNRLNEMAVDARGEMTAVGVTFSPMLAWRRALISEAARTGIGGGFGRWAFLATTLQITGAGSPRRTTA